MAKEDELKQPEKEFEIPDDDEIILEEVSGEEEEDELITMPSLVKELIIKLIIMVVGIIICFGILGGICALLSK